MWWFPQLLLSFPSFSFVAAFHSALLSPAFPIQQPFSCSSIFFFCLFTSYSTSFLLFQPSFPSSLALLNLNLSCSSSSVIPASFLLFLFLSFLPLLFLLPPSSPPPLHIPVTSMWWFPQFSLSFPGSGAPRSSTLSIPDSLYCSLILPYINYGIFVGESTCKT